MKTKNMFSFSFIISDISFNLTNHYTMTMTSLGTSKVPFFLKLTQEMWLKVMSKEMPCLTDNNEKSLLFFPERVDDCTIWQSVRIGEERKYFSQNVVVSINVMWFYIYIDRQSTNVQNFGTVCWFWPWFISSRSRLIYKLLQSYCNLKRVGHHFILMMFGIDINFYQFSDVDPRKRNDCDILHFSKRTKQRLCSSWIGQSL